MTEQQPKVVVARVSVQHSLTDAERESIHTGTCIVCRGEDLEVFTGKSGEGICVNANACFGRYCKLPDEVVKDD